MPHHISRGRQLSDFLLDSARRRLLHSTRKQIGGRSSDRSRFVFVVSNRPRCTDLAQELGVEELVGALRQDQLRQPRRQRTQYRTSSTVMNDEINQLKDTRLVDELLQMHVVGDVAQRR